MMSTWLRLLTRIQVLRRTQTFSCISSSHARTFANKSDDNSNQIMVKGTENERVRVRRARAGDVPRVLRFVREHARAAWPGLAAAPASPHLVLCDYVARALAQGHSMLAEQQEPRRGWTQIKGVALSVAVCPWDASLLEKLARCVRCSRSRRLMAFTAHCLRAPALHDKYRVHSILQVVLVTAPDNSNNAEIISILSKSAIKRARESGFPLIRFDVTCDKTAKILEDQNLIKEWQLSYGVLSEAITNDTDDVTHSSVESFINSKDDNNTTAANRHYITVYTAQIPGANKKC